MTLEYLLNELCELGIRHNLVNYAAAGGSIYTLNSETIQDYPYFFFSPTEDIRIEKNFTTYGLTVFYVERLLPDNMNDTQVYSNGTLAIQNLMRQVKAMDGIVGVDDYNIRVFSETEKMADKVNGAYARVNITTLNSYNCSIYFDETGAPMGTYVPDVIKDTSVLDALASKEWVKRYVSGVAEGITEDEAKELIRKALLAYTKTDKFATINGSGITNNEVYELLNTSEFREFLSGYTQEILEIRSEISAATPSDYDEVKGQVSANTQDIETIKQSMSALTPSDYDEVKRQVSANTENIATLSASTSGLSFTINEHAEKIERLETAVSGINETISTQSSAITGINEAVSSLSAQTSANTAQILALSGYTEQAVSSINQELENVYVAISAATPSDYDAVKTQVSANTENITTLSGSTSGLSADLASLSAFTETLADGMSETTYVDLSDGSTGAQVYAKIDSAYTAGKEVILRAIDYTYRRDGTQVLLPFSRKNGSDYYFQGSWVQEAGSPNFQQYFVKIKSNGTTEGTSTSNNIIYAYRNVFARYTLPTAAANTKGGVKVGSGLTMNGEVMSVNAGSGLTVQDGAIRTTYLIWEGSQEDYDLIATKDSHTLYIIK